MVPLGLNVAPESSQRIGIVDAGEAIDSCDEVAGGIGGATPDSALTCTRPSPDLAARLTAQDMASECRRRKSALIWIFESLAFKADQTALIRFIVEHYILFWNNE